MGLLTVRRRRLTAAGVQPIGLIQPTFAWFDLDGAVAPTTGERVFLELPSLNADTFQLVIDAFAPAFPDSLNSLLVDHGAAHTAHRIRWPAHVQPVWLPPSGPALNPIARGWREVQDDLAWEPCTALDGQQASVATVLQADDAPTLQALTGYADLVDAINALCS